MAESFRERAQRIRLLALDVDGVLTDGRIQYTSGGDELKSFSVLDGLGLKLLRQRGVAIAIITARKSPVVERRARELQIDHVMQGREDKLDALRELLERTGIELDETAYIGDDLPDLKAIRAVGLGMTVANASPHVARHAIWQSTASGGGGAVREACEWLLRERGELEEALAPYVD